MRRWVEWGLSEPGEPGLFDYVMIYVHGYRPGERVFAIPADDATELLKFVRLVADNPMGGHAVTARELLARLSPGPGEQVARPLCASCDSPATRRDADGHPRCNLCGPTTPGEPKP